MEPVSNHRMQSLLADCLDIQKANRTYGSSSIDVYHQYLKSDDGMRDLGESVNNEIMGPIAIFLCAGMKHRHGVTFRLPPCIDKNTVNLLLESFLPPDKGPFKLKPTSHCLQHLIALVLDDCYSSFGCYIQKKDAVCVQGWLRQESLEMGLPPGIAVSKKDQLQDSKRRLIAVEKGLLRLHICLLLGETGNECTDKLAKAWGIKARTIRYERDGMRKALSQKSRQREKPHGLMSPSFSSPAYKKPRGPRPSPISRIIFQQTGRASEVPVRQPTSTAKSDSPLLMEAPFPPPELQPDPSLIDASSLVKGGPPPKDTILPDRNPVVESYTQPLSRPDPFAIGKLVLALPTVHDTAEASASDVAIVASHTNLEWRKNTFLQEPSSFDIGDNAILPSGGRTFSLCNQIAVNARDAIHTAPPAIITPTEDLVEEGNCHRFDWSETEEDDNVLGTDSITTPTNGSISSPSTDDSVSASTITDSVTAIGGTENDPLDFESETAMAPVADSLEEVRVRLERAEKPHEAKILRRTVNNVPSHFVEVPKSSNMEQWVVNARKRQWLEKVLHLSTTGTMTSDEAAVCAIVAISKKHPGVFEAAGQRLGYPSLIQGPMDVHTAASMWNKAGVSKNGQRIIRRYIHGCFGIWITPPEKKIESLVSHIVTPTHGVASVGARKIHFWYKDVDDVVVNLLENEWKSISFHSMDVVFGGDHGQGVFGAAVKVILWTSDWQVAASAVRKVGHIDCTKDTYDVLKATIAGQLNVSLHRIKGRVLRLISEGDERVALFEDKEDNDASSLGSGSELIANNDNGAAIGEENESSSLDNGTGPDFHQANDPSSLRNCGTFSLHEVQVLGVGDLAFISMVLGKVNMDGQWCYLCDLSPNQWCESMHTPGRPWTLHLMNEKLAKLARNELKDIPSNRRGCVAPSLMDVFEPIDFIPPCLHIMMGAFNDALKMLFKYVDDRHEQISPEEEEKRNRAWQTETAYVRAQDDLHQFIANKQMQMEAKKLEIATLEAKKGMLNPAGTGTKYVYSREQKRIFNIQIGFIKESISNLREEENAKRSDVTEKKTARDKAKKDLYDERKKRRTVDCNVRQSIEELLKKHGIDRGASHGGELTGVACLVMEDRIDPLMKDIKQTLKDASTPDVPSTEVDEVIDSYEIHFLLLSKLFSLARTEKRVFKDAARKTLILNEMRQTISLINQSTKRLGLSMKTPKRHICDDHLVTFVDTHDGVAEYLEDWLEQIHQTYKKMNSRGKIRDMVVKGNYESKSEAISQNVNVKVAGLSMMQKTRRNFRVQRPTKMPTAFAKKQARRERRDDAAARAQQLFDSRPILLESAEQNTDYAQEGTL